MTARGQPRQVTSISGDRVMHSSLSPDGTRVAFISSANGHATVWVQHIDGSGVTALTNDEIPNAWPVWSPDGKEIMYSSGREIMIVKASGGQPRKLMDGFFRGDWISRPAAATGFSLPMFNRDGSAISFAFADGTDRQGIAVVDTATRRRRIAVRFSEPFQIMFRAGWIEGDRAFAVNRVTTRSHIVMFDGLLPSQRNPSATDAASSGRR